MLAVGLWGIAVIGFLMIPVRWYERLIAFAAGLALIMALPVSDEIGFGLAVLFFLLYGLRQRAKAQAA